MDLLDISIQSRVIIGISAMVVLFISFLIVFITNHQKKLLYHKNLQLLNEEKQENLRQQNAILEEKVKERTAQLSTQKETLQQTLSDLNDSQQQLIHKEKMASLGELTSGIAHEIQNPLNFVLNFGEINVELIEEIKTLLKEQALPDGFITEVQPMLNDMADNMQKILLHGKRADGIVKNMLQHAKRNDGILELTDINELTDEYLKLSYYGFRAKHKSFVCTFHTQFHPELPPINVIPQQIGQALVNLFNNAFYALNEKSKQSNQPFTPELMVETSYHAKKIQLTIRDNGIGIPPKIIQKIFQPFFTTKPTGDATGLGLSLSYDMIKAHQGDIQVTSEWGEYTQFTILLPS